MASRHVPSAGADSKQHSRVLRGNHASQRGGSAWLTRSMFDGSITVYSAVPPKHKLCRNHPDTKRSENDENLKNIEKHSKILTNIEKYWNILKQIETTTFANYGITTMLERNLFVLVVLVT